MIRRTVSLLSLCLLAAGCGQSGPSEGDLKAALSDRTGVGTGNYAIVKFAKIACSPLGAAFVCDVTAQTRNNPMGASWDRPMQVSMRVSRSAGSSKWAVEEILSTKPL